MSLRVANVEFSGREVIKTRGDAIQAPSRREDPDS
jgi:hypothetical protein